MSKKKQKSKDAPSPPEAKDTEPEIVEAAEPDAVEATPSDAGSEADESTPGGDAAGSGWGAGEVEELRAENAELKDRLLRTIAEMENVRRRTERDKVDTAKYAISNFARDVLTIADNVALAIAHVPDDAAEKDSALKSLLDGMMVTERELLNMMERHGITRVEPFGERFDPNLHQAMFEVENKDVPEGTIQEVIQAGYVISDRVLRPAMVGVTKGGDKPARAGSGDATPQAANDDTPDKDKPHGETDAGVGSQIDESA